MLQNVVSLRHSVIISLLVILVYAPGLSGGFLYDDYFNFLKNAAITDTDFSLNSLWLAMNSGVSGPLGRPIPMLSFFFNYKLDGVSPLGYKILNLFIHVINAILIYFVSCHLLKALYSRDKTILGDTKNNLMAFWLAMIWAVHPINLTGVLYIVQRMTSMSATFVLAGILVYLRLRENMKPGYTGLYLTAILVFGILAALCKENGILLFLFLMLIEYFIYQGVFKDKNQKNYILLFFTFIFIALLTLAGYLLFKGGINIDFEHRDFTFQERLLTQARVIWFYIMQILLPQAHLFGLHHDDFSLSVGLLKPASTLFSIIGLLLIVSILVFLRRKYALLGLGISFFLVGHLLESTIFPLNLVHEHRNYLPSFGLILAFICCLSILLERIRVINRNIIFLLFTGLLALVTIGQASDWGDMNQYAELSLQRHPRSVNTNYEAAFIFMKTYEQTGNRYYLDKSINAFKRAEALSKHSMKPAIALLHVYAIAGIQPEDKLVDKINLNLASGRIKTEEMIAIRQLVNCKTMLICHIEDAVFHDLFSSILGNISLQGRLRDDSLYIYASYLESLPDNRQQALDILKDIVARNPATIEYKVKLITTLLNQGRSQEAILIMDELTKKYGFKWNLVEQEKEQIKSRMSN